MCVFMPNKCKCVELYVTGLRGVVTCQWTVDGDWGGGKGEVHVHTNRDRKLNFGMDIRPTF